MTNTDAMPSPHQVHQPPLRARLHALLQHSDSHLGSSPAMSPSSDTPSHHQTISSPLSSSTSLESANRVVSITKPALKRRQPGGAISVLSTTSKQSSSSATAPLAFSPPPRMAALPRSVTTTRLDDAATRSQRSNSHSSGPSRASSLDPSHLSADAPMVASTAEQAQKVDPSSSRTRQRPSIKVRIITWNMHDSVPKGDLEVLLGKAGQYVAPEPDWDISYDSDEDNSDVNAGQRQPRGAHVVGQEDIPRADRIPPLPHDDSHPYHLLVIAGQECPWGDGKRLATSVGMAGELGDFGKQKNRTAKEKDHLKDRSRPFKTKDKQRSGDSDSLPNVAEGSKTANSTTDETPSSNQGKDSLTVLSDDSNFQLFSSSSSSALSPGQPLASPMIGGTSMPSFNSMSDAQADDKPTTWPNLGGKGWSDLCEDWLCRNQAIKKEKDHKEKSFISGARLARALSQSASKKDFGLSRESLNDQHPSMPMQSFSASVTPELSRAASPICMPMSTSVPGTPNQSTFEGFNAYLDNPAPLAADASASAVPAEKRKRIVPKLNLNTAELVRRTAASGRSSPANFTDAGCVSSPVLLSPTAVLPKSHSQPLPLAPTSAPERPSEATTTPAFTGTGGLLAVPEAPAMSRMSSSHSLSKLALTTQPASPSISHAPAEVHIEPPTPSLTPSPCPSTSLHAQNAEQTLRESAPSPAPPAAATKSNDAGAHIQAPERAFSDTLFKALGPYELVIKERMMGCYMAVYVWRGCKDRIRGASRSHVKSGLLAGRLGNKGGVGISLKLGTTRLLFVNAHLAAHEDKVALRLANIAKIKAALKVDSFLPADDPRSRLEDITEQFDHTFWFGDLNFRIDISRQHADWLMMHKKYDQALAFDQLGRVLKDGDAFKGFKEAPINFPPTYKYDVLKTLKIKRNRTVTSIRNAIDIPGASAASTHKLVTSDLVNTPVGESVIPEEGTVSVDAVHDPAAQAGDISQLSETAGNFGPDTLSVQDDASCSTSALAISPNALGESAEPQDADRSDEDRYSIASSSAFGSVASSSGFARSFQSQEARLPQGIDPALARERELELQRQRQLADNTSAAQGPRFFSQGAAIKAKFKLRDMVRNAASTNLKEKLGGAVNSDNQPGGRKKWLNVLSDAQKRVVVPAAVSSDVNPDLESVGSTPSCALERSTSAPRADDSSAGSGKRASLLSMEGRLSSVGDGEAPPVRGGWSSDGHNSSTNEETAGSASVPIAAGSRRSSLQLATDKAHRDAKYPHLTGATAEQIDFLEAQPYDTSAKQRVPSWCDRVLFRSTVPLDPDDVDDADETQHGSSKTGSNDPGLGSRVGSALSQALIMPLRQAAERRQHMHAQRSTSSGLIAAVAGSSSIAFAHDQAVPAEVSLVDPATCSPSAARRARSSTTTSAPSTAAMPSPKPDTRTLAGLERTRPPHLLQRFLHPGRRRHQVKALSPSLTFSDLTHLPHEESTMSGKNASIDLVPTSVSLGLESVEGAALASLEPKAASTVDLPSQVEERDNRFDGVAKRRIASRVASPHEVQARVAIPPRQASSPRETRQLRVSPTAEEPLKQQQQEKEVGRAQVHAKRSTSLAVFSSSREMPSPTSPPAAPIRYAPPLPPRRTFTTAPTPAAGTESARGGWMDSLSSHLPSFFYALRSHRQSASDKQDAASVDKAQDNDAEQEPLVGPKKGRIDCLLYKALDDREMRLLQGRSDHRPVIFVGAIGI